MERKAKGHGTSTAKKPDQRPGGDTTGVSALGRELRLRIKEELGRCDGGATPKVCGAISTLEGYLAIEAMVIGIVALEGCAVGAAIANLEAELP